MYHLAKSHFKKHDPILYRAAQRHTVPNVKRSRDVFRDLVHAVTNQQLSGKAADTIFGRLETLVGKRGISPKTLLTLHTPSFRKCGFSEAKAKTIRALAQAIVDGKLDLVSIHKHQDPLIMDILTSVKGIGPWTAEMILMFSLGRTDIFSKGDLGLRKGIMRLYSLRGMPTDRQIEKLSRAWTPYRTYAARVLWRVADEEK